MKSFLLIISTLLITACHSVNQSTEKPNAAPTLASTNSEPEPQNEINNNNQANVFGNVFMRKPCSVEKVIPGVKSNNSCGEKQPVKAKLFVTGLPNQSITLESNASGQFSLHLNPGDYSIRAEMKPLAQSPNITFTVNDKSDVQLSVELRLKHMPR